MRLVCGLALAALCACGERPATVEEALGGAGRDGGVAGGLPAARHALGYPTRIAQGRSGRIAVTDARLGAAFVLDAALAPAAEAGGIGGALGVAVTDDGTPCVGSASRRAVLCLEPGGKVRALGEGLVAMPNDLAFDHAGRLYVADSAADRVQVLERSGALARTIGAGPAPAALAFPAAVAIAYPPAHPQGELYVADQRNGRVAVFDLRGGFRRALGQPAPAFGTAWQGRFSRLQALAVDALGRVHALDAYQGQVQVLDGETGAFLEAYGAFGSGPGQLSVPLGLAILRDGRVVVANAGNGRLEVLRTLPPAAAPRHGGAR